MEKKVLFGVLFLVAVSLVCIVVAVPAVMVLGLIGALTTLIVQYLLLAAAFLHVTRPITTERTLVREAFAATRLQLIRSAPNVLATLITTGAQWLTTIFVVKQSHGMAGVGVFAVSSSWLTITMMPVNAWSGLSMHVLSSAWASSQSDFRAALRHVLIKDVSFTLLVAVSVFILADHIAGLYAMKTTVLPTILRVNSGTALVLAAMQVMERSMFCLGEQPRWLQARVIGNLCTLGLAVWLVPMNLAYGAIAMFSGYTCTALLCIPRLRRAA